MGTNAKECVKLHPFFSYFGSKYRLAGLYPEPQERLIIEPFAGSAGYSLLYPNRKVILYDNYPDVVTVWKYLIKATKSEIEALPIREFSKKNPISDLDVEEGAKILIGFWTTESQTYPSTYPLSTGPKGRGSNWTERKRKLIASQVEYIKDWEVNLSDYQSVPLTKATWFVDPPYRQAGKRYKRSRIDYEQLGLWCKSLPGQAIVCEQNNADWLTFEPFEDVNNASNKKYKEVMWTNK